jgi:glycosyltransferase involved in cell wall biosynthesis
MKSNILLSIIVPIYNVEFFLEKNIKSILSQTYENIELLLVDDGSTDNSLSICYSFSKIDKRIRVLHKTNGGLSDARNFGIKNSKGDYIGFVDGDDFIEPDMYEALLNASICNNTLISVAGRYKVSSDKKVSMFTLNKGIKFNSKKAIKLLLQSKFLDSSACDKLFHRSLFDTILFPLNKYNEDIFIMVRIIDKAGSIFHIGSPKYNYVVRENSITNHKFTPKKMDLIQACNEVNYFIKSNYISLYLYSRSFYVRNLFYLKASFENDKRNLSVYKNEKKLLTTEFRKIIFDIILNPFIPFLYRLRGYLMLLNLYPIIRKVLKK